jgi:hypothetical protein
MRAKNRVMVGLSVIFAMQGGRPLSHCSALLDEHLGHLVDAE